MSRKRKYPDNAARQKAYRERRNVTLKTLRNMQDKHKDYDQALLYMLRLVRSGRETAARAVMVAVLSEFTEFQYQKFYSQLRLPEIDWSSV